MVRIIEAINIQISPGVYKPFIKGYCLSTDTMPADCITGSNMTAVDTGDVYYYDEVSEAWAVPTASE